MNIFTLPLKKAFIHSIIISFFLIVNNVEAQIPTPFSVNTTLTPEQLVELLVGDGIEFSNVTLTGAVLSYGSFQGTSNIGIESGVILTSGRASIAIGPNNKSNDGFENHTPGDPDLNAISGSNSNDACILEFDFVPVSDLIEFRYVFASEEYPEYVNQINDAFGFFIYGPGLPPGPYMNSAKNIAIVPNTLPPMPVTINNVNSNVNSAYYVSNPEGPNTTIEYDGFTTVLTARSPVTHCETYHIKLVVGDISDWAWDSGVFLEANSFNSVGIGSSLSFANAELDTVVENCNSVRIAFKLNGTATSNFEIDLEILNTPGSATNGVDYVEIPTQLIIPWGQDSAYVDIIPLEDGPEPYETIELVYNSSLCQPIYDTVKVFIKDKPPFEASFSPPSYSIGCGENRLLYGSIDGGQKPYHYLWNTGETTDTLRVSPGTTTTYQVKVWDACGEIDSSYVTINVGGPEANITLGDTISICKNTTQQLFVEGGTSWQWVSQPYDPTLTTAIDTLQDPTVGPLVNTLYIVTVYDTCGNTDIDSLYIKVGQPYASASADYTTICKGDTATLSANITPGGVYEWRIKGGAVIPGGNQRVVEVSPMVNTTYEVRVWDNCGNDTIAEITITVLQLDILVSCTDDEICIGEETTLNATSSLGGAGATFEWNGGGETFYGASVLVSPETTTTYIVTVNDGCIKDGDPVIVNVNPLPVLSITPTNDAVCYGESTTLTAANANGDMTSYAWTSSPADPSIVGQETQVSVTVAPTINSVYTVVGIDGNGCENNKMLGINVVELPTANFTIAPKVCEGDPVTIDYEGNAGFGATYDWNFDGGSAVPGTGQGPHDVTWSTLGTKNLSLTVTTTSPRVCPGTPFNASIEVFRMPKPQFTFGNAKGCVPLTVDFTNTSTNTDPTATYSWDFGAAGVSGQQSPSVEFTEPGLYSVTLRVSNAECEDETGVPSAVNAYPVPVPSFTMDPEKVSLKNPVITFTSTTAGDSLTYEWSTDDGHFYDTPTFTHTYADSGVYNVVLKVTNEYTCTDSLKLKATVTPKYMLKIPTAFTPNGDGINDLFTVQGNGVKKYSINIYNRWGSLIYESKNISQSWDGKVNGQPAEPGLYVYRTYFMDDNDEVSEQTGSFTLVK